MFGDAMREFKLALVFLTRLPVRLEISHEGPELAASAPMFGLAGALIGATGAGTYLLAFELGLGAPLAAVLAVASLVLTTGGLHEDGLADVADGFGGGRESSEKLAIMRDPRLGSFGAIALVLALFLRIGALAALAAPLSVAPALVAAGAISRGVLPLAMTLWPTARADGLAATAGRPHLGRSLAALLVAGLLGALVIGTAASGIALLFASGAALGVAVLARHQIGGLTGDVLGAMQQLAEIACLLALVAIARPVAA